MRVLVYAPCEHDSDGVVAEHPQHHRWAALILKPDGTLWPVHCTAPTEDEVRAKAASFIRHTIQREPRPKAVKAAKRQAAPVFEEEAI